MYVCMDARVVYLYICVCVFMRACMLVFIYKLCSQKSDEF